MQLDINKQEHKERFAGTEPSQRRTPHGPCRLPRMKIGLQHIPECQLPRGAEGTGGPLRIGTRMAKARLVGKDRHLLTEERQCEEIASCGCEQALRKNLFKKPLMAGILKTAFDKSGYRR